MGIATNVLGILKKATGAARIGRGGSTVDADLTTLETGQSTLSDTLTAEAGKVATLQRQVVPLARAVRVIMSGSDTVEGIKIPDNVETDFNKYSFMIRLKCALQSYTPAGTILWYLFEGGSDRMYLSIGADGKLSFNLIIGGSIIYNSSNSKSTIAVAKNDNESAVIDLIIKRETVSEPGFIKYAVDGEILGDPIVIAAGEPASWSINGELQVLGNPSTGVQYAGQFVEAVILNRAPTDAEVLSSDKNGFPPNDIGTPGNRASQVPVFETDFSVNADQIYSQDDVTVAGNQTVASVEDCATITVGSTQDFHIAEMDAQCVVGSQHKLTGRVYLPSSNGNVSYVRIRNYGGTSGAPVDSILLDITTTDDFVDIDITFIAQSQYLQVQMMCGGCGNPSVFTGNGTDTVSIVDFKVKRTGITALYSAEHAQSDTGQMFGQINGNHALLPPEGATIFPQPEGLRQVKAELTWNGDSTAKYLLSNQDILPDGFDIERVKAVVSGTPVDGTLGDSVDPDRYCTLAKNTDLIEGSNTLALSQRTGNGNNDLLWKPSAAFTGTIKFYIYYFVGEQ